MKNNTNAFRIVVAMTMLILITVPFVFACKHEVVHAAVVEEATCVHNGLENLVCEKCEDILETNEISARGHDFSDYILVVKPGKDTNGVEERECDNCGEKESREYICPHAITEAFVVIEPTCNSEGRSVDICIECDSIAKDNVVDMLPHAETYVSVIAEPTCTEEGVEHAICCECETVVEEKTIEKLECEYGDWEIIEKSTCIALGERHRICKNCNGVEKETMDYAECEYAKIINSEYDNGAYTLVNTCECICGKIKQETEKVYWGFSGKLVIDAVDVKVNTYSSMAQSVCDRVNSACYFNYNGVYVVADHWNQGFENIKRCSVGDIAALGDKTYQCINVFYGHNTGHSLTDNDYKDISTYEGDLFMYTCNDGWQNIAIVVWEQI